MFCKSVAIGKVREGMLQQMGSKCVSLRYGANHPADRLLTSEVRDPIITAETDKPYFFEGVCISLGMQQH